METFLFSHGMNYTQKKISLTVAKNTSRITTEDFIMVTVYKINIQSLYFCTKYMEIKMKNMPPFINTYKTNN